MFQREKFVEHNANAVAAGRVSGVDPIEQITKRCIRIVNPEAEVSACVLCRGYDFSKSGFGPRMIIMCDQILSLSLSLSLSLYIYIYIYTCMVPPFTMYVYIYTN
ncbi:unnamed protein product, partial [Vitis vinifera]|uniref:Uncharacterized protein n=1 Tax=Vitis vinifera TaxID=29760 RepID=D7TY45_VITVI